jgi:S-(hydroxymethyl)glutathione dehydrogenase/alcohol dehydrogenase
VACCHSDQCPCDPKFGATHVVNPANGDTVEQVRALTGGHGVDHAFEVIGLIPTLEQATQILDHGGTVYVVGMQKPGARLSVDVDPMQLSSLLHKEQSVKGVMMGSTKFKLDIPLYAEMYLQGRFNLDDLVSTTSKVARSVITFN